jgi:hypothetical protein
MVNVNNSNIERHIEDICLVQCKIGIYFTEWVPNGIYFTSGAATSEMWTLGVHKVKYILYCQYI